MSIHFSKIIKAGERNREFNFTRTNPSSTQYNVNVPDERGNRIFFTMQQENGAWRILPDVLPPWVISVEDELSKAIEEEGKTALDKENRTR